MNIDQIRPVAALLAERNAIDATLARLINRPPSVGHLGEWIAAAIFDIQLEESATTKAIDGRFRSGPLAGRTVNVKYYGKREGILDTTDDPILDYYLVFTGQKTAAGSSKGKTRPFIIANAYLFDAHQLRSQQHVARLKSGVASSVRNAFWDAAEIFPAHTNPALTVSAEQAAALRLFG